MVSGRPTKCSSSFPFALGIRTTSQVRRTMGPTGEIHGKTGSVLFNPSLRFGGGAGNRSSEVVAHSQPIGAIALGEIVAKGLRGRVRISHPVKEDATRERE